LNAHELGLWAWSTILAVPVAQALITIQAVLVPSLARLYGQYRDQFQEACDRSARLIALIAAAGAGALFGLAPPIVEQIFGDRWTGAVGAVQVTVLGIVPLAMFQFLSAILASRGQAGVRFRCALIASLVSLALIYPLMKVWGITGAALASAVVGPVVDAVLLAVYAEVPLRRAGINAVAALGAVGGISLLLGGMAGAPATLAAAAIATALAALVVIYLVDRQVMRYAWSLLRKQQPVVPMPVPS
jgi:O-antigen/teichoic acid export membrane protein